MNVLIDDRTLETADYLAITAQLARYAVALDDRDFDAVGDIFTAGAQATFSGKVLTPGREAIVTHVSGLSELVASTHLLGQPLIRVVGETVVSETPAVAHLVVETGHGMVVRSRGLRYTDTWVKQDLWRISVRLHRADWMYETPATRG